MANLILFLGPTLGLGLILAYVIQRDYNRYWKNR